MKTKTIRFISFAYLSILLILLGCNSDNGEKFTGGVWYSENINFNIETGGGNSGNLWITIKKENGLFMCYYCHKTDCFVFPISYENGVMKGVYNNSQVELRLTNTNSLFVNGFEVKTLNEQVLKSPEFKQWLDGDEFKRMGVGSFKVIYEAIKG